jgi:hypothetical protein
VTTVHRTGPASARPALPAAWIQLYYWATALFFLADLTVGASFRAAGLPHDAARYMYYVLCLGCAFACRRWPQYAGWVGMGESAVNIFLLILSVMGPIFALPDALLAGQDAGVAMPPGKVVNFVISGTVMWLSFQRSQALATGSAAWIRR